MLITLEDEVLHFSFDSVFAFPNIQVEKELYYAIPSQQIMEEKILVPLAKKEEDIDFVWEEKDSLKVKGKLRIEEL
jgi:hypothetical protein